MTLIEVRTDRAENLALHRRRVATPSGPPLASRAGAGPAERQAEDARTGAPLTSKRDRPGDIVVVDKKGRRFHALVTELEQLEIRPLRAGRASAGLARLLPQGHRARGARGLAQAVPAV